MRDALQLGAVLADLGLTIAADAAAVQLYVEQRAAVLRHVAGQPGYEEAVRAEGMNVALYALGRAIDEADALDAKIVNVLTTVLALTIRLL